MHLEPIEFKHIGDGYKYCVSTSRLVFVIASVAPHHWTLYTQVHFNWMSNLYKHKVREYFFNFLYYYPRKTDISYRKLGLENFDIYLKENFTAFSHLHEKVNSMLITRFVYKKH